jgi:hypothetical protein
LPTRKLVSLELPNPKKFAVALAKPAGAARFL